MTRGSRVLRGLAAAMAMLLAQSVQAQSGDLGALRAGFLVNFAKLSSWPDTRFETPDSPVRLCLHDADPNTKALSQSLGGKPVGARALQIVPINDLKSVKGGNCHIAYLGPELQTRLDELVPALAATGSLVVDEGSRFTWPDGMIRLFLEDGRMRFELNLSAVERAELKIDPRLIRLARLAVR